MENECEALPGVAHPGVRDNRSTLNTETGYDDDDDCTQLLTMDRFVTSAKFDSGSLLTLFVSLSESCG